MPVKTELVWRSPSEIVQLGFRRSRAVMMNEAHNGLRRSVRTRIIGQNILAAAHEEGARFLAMEALVPFFAEVCNRERSVPETNNGYLSQIEMRAFIRTALDLGWMLIPYEADDNRWKKPNKDFRSIEYVNWREEEQARNLISALKNLPIESKLLVWCGNGHHRKAPCQDWVPMGYQFHRLSGIDPFVIDQALTVRFDPNNVSFGEKIGMQFESQLRENGGTAGFLRGEGPADLTDFSEDAFILSIDNELE
jgi:hypothetical protein